MNRRPSFVSWVTFVAGVAVLATSVAALAAPRDTALMGALMRMELAGQVVAEAQKLSDLPEVAEAAQAMQSRLFGRARDGLISAFHRLYVLFSRKRRAHQHSKGKAAFSAFCGGFQDQTLSSGVARL